MYEELIKTILEDFNTQRIGDSLLKSLEDKLRINVAGYREAQIYAEKNASILTQLLREIIDGSYLVDGTIPYDLSSELLPEALKDLHKGVAEYSRDIQTAINKKAGVNIKGQLLEFNDEQIDRVTRFAKKVSECKSENTFRSFLEAGIDNYSRSIVDDTAKYNAKFNYGSGVAGKIVRTTTNNSCKWCREVAGEYKYPGTPKDVFRRHQRCTCIVEYFPDKHRYRQDVWTKKKFKLLEREADRQERVERLKNFNLRSFRLGGSPLNRTLKKTMTKDQVDFYTDKLNNAPSFVKKVWNKYKNSFRLEKVDSDIAYFQPYETKVYMNLNKDTNIESKMHDGAIFFHEFGHNIDYLKSKELGFTKYYERASNALGDTIYNEIKSLKEYHGGHTLIQEIARQSRLRGIENYCAVSDLITGYLGYGDTMVPWSHRVEYWRDENFYDDILKMNNREEMFLKYRLGSEGFAEFFSATTLQSKQVEVIEEWLPNSYDHFLTMLKDWSK